MPQKSPDLFRLGSITLGGLQEEVKLCELSAEHPRPWPSLVTLQVSGRLTQRWEHCTADLTLSTKVVTSVWYSISAMDVSLFLTGQSRKGGPSQHAGMATWWL